MLEVSSIRIKGRKYVYLVQPGTNIPFFKTNGKPRAIRAALASTTGRRWMWISERVAELLRYATYVPSSSSTRPLEKAAKQSRLACWLDN